MPLFIQNDTAASYSGDPRIDSLIDNAMNWNEIKNRNVLKYSFNMNIENLDYFQPSQGVLGGRTEFSNAQKIAANEILSKISAITGVQFEEAALAKDADIVFNNSSQFKQNGDGTTTSGHTVESYAPVFGLNTAHAMIQINTLNILTDNQLLNQAVTPSYNYEVLLHEIGHAMGLGHPFQDPLHALNNIYNDTVNTVMSYNRTTENFKSDYQPFDVLTLQWIYGKDGLRGTNGFGSTTGSHLPINLLPIDSSAPVLADYSNNVFVSTKLKSVSFDAKENIRAAGNFILWDTTSTDTVNTNGIQWYKALTANADPSYTSLEVPIHVNGTTITFDISNLPALSKVNDLFEIRASISTDAAGNKYPWGYISDMVGNRLATTGANDAYFSFKTGIVDGSGNKLEGSTLSDALLGAAGNDILIAHAGNNIVEGGADIDTAIFDHALADFAIQKVSTTAWKIDAKNKVDGTNAVNAVEIFKFADATMDLTVQTQLASMNPSTVHHLIELYAAFFNRIPDADGLLYWAKQIKSGTSMQQVTESFYTAGMHYATNNTTSSTTDFVHSIYQNVLGRADGGDSSGVAYWSKQLDQGTQTYGSLVSTMLDAAHSYKNGTSEFAWVANLLDNKISVGEEFAINLGVTYSTPELSIAHGVEIAKAITATDTSAALKLIGVTDLPHV